ncbi:calcitonin receptor-like [Mytilus edulis]|uniref:calcitonin receptor-like n=1 Tax=Mytilus edulis TaxID=6550 RepID=UPI0039F13104
MDLLSETFLRIRDLQQKCNTNIRKYKPPLDGNLYCNATSDTLGGCWNITRAGQSAKIPCPELMKTSSYGSAYLNCTEHGTWNTINGSIRGDYTHCQFWDAGKGDHLPVYVFIAGNVVSIILLSVALTIFFRFRQLKCGRIFIHKNLFLSYILTGLTWILYNSLVVLNSDLLEHNYVWCQVLHVLAHFSMVCNFAWMFCEGLYLHTLLQKAYQGQRVLIIICVIIGWVVPVFPTIIYAVLRAISTVDNTVCWMNESSLQWIMYGPIVISLAVNIIFLINIVRLLMTKLKDLPEAAQNKKAARATLVLIPLLGFQYLLLPMRPEHGSPFEDVYSYCSAILTSCQGAFVSIIYCFCNGEVVSLLSRKWKQYRLMHCTGSAEQRFPSMKSNDTEQMCLESVREESPELMALTEANQ